MKHTLNFAGLIPKLPIIQGGMGVGISLHQLAGHVASCGGIGVISSAQVGYQENDFLKNPSLANERALIAEVQKAKAMAPQGIIGVNIMVALKDYERTVKAAVKAGADLIISGAGLPMELPLLTKGSITKLAPIVSSGKAAQVICRFWDKRYQKAPDLVVVEGPLAGGHLGFSLEELKNPPNVLDLMTDVKKVLLPYEEKYDKKIPVVVAGGFYTGEDVAQALKAGADGVQMATRFVTTYECDAALSYKEAYLHATKEQIGIVKSPVGMPGRGILNDFIQNVPGNQACYYHCMAKCAVTTIPYCISKALIAAAKGELQNALLFCGSNAYRATHLEHVADIFKEIEMALS